MFAPIEVIGQSFFGALAVMSSKPSPADSLPNAPPIGDSRKARKPPTATTPERRLIPLYDFGFQMKPGAIPVAAPTTPTPTSRFGKPAELKVVPEVKFFNVITAAIPHGQIAESYRKEFASAAAYEVNRDSPNYLRYEVQRVDVTNQPHRNIDENEWRDAPSCSIEAQQKERMSWPERVTKLRLLTLSWTVC